jgi:hypothetical protein
MVMVMFEVWVCVYAYEGVNESFKGGDPFRVWLAECGLGGRGR